MSLRDAQTTRPVRLRGHGALMATSAALASTLLICSAVAAPPPLPGAVEPGRDRPPPQAPTQPELDFRLESPERSPVPRAADQVHFQLTDIKVVGTTVFSAASFRPLYEDLLGKDVTLANVLDVADKIEARYRAAGYFLIRAYVPPQRVKNGVFTIDVVEGHVSSVSVEGASQHTQSIARSYFHDVVTQKPLAISTIERALLLANDIPGVSASGTLRPSPVTQGASELIVTESAPWIEGGVATNNRGSRFSGLWTLSANAEFNDLIGGDQLGIVGNTSPDAKEQVSGQATYRKTLGPDGLVGSIFGVYTHGEPGSTLAVAGVLTNSWAAGPHFVYPWIRSREFSLLVEGGLTFQQATIHTAGVVASHDQWRVFDAGVSFLGNGFLGGGWGGSLDVSQGLPFLGATPDGSPRLSRPGATTDFTKITSDFHFNRELLPSFTIALSGSGQFAFNHLITGEEVSYGGTQVVRGFDPGSITGDRGIGGAAELHYDLRLPKWKLNVVEPYAYVDGARAWYIHATAFGLKNESIASVGGGFRFFFPYNITADVEGSQMLNAVPGSDAGHRATKVLMDAAIQL